MRKSCWILGMITLVLVWCVLPLLAPSGFFAHMIMHMGVVAVASPLLAIGLAGGRWDPVVRFPRWFAPIPISLVELVVVWTWHAPGFHHVARQTVLGLLAEQGMFLGCGLALWISAFGGPTPRDVDRAAAGVIALLLTMMHMVLLGALLALAPRTLYAHGANHGAHHEGNPFRLTPLEDQQLGGTIMLIGGGVSYLMGGLWLSGQLLQKNAIQPKGYS